jgi:hypothetical protein
MFRIGDSLHLQVANNTKIEAQLQTHFQSFYLLAPTYERLSFGSMPQ